MTGDTHLKSVVRPCPICGNTSGEVLHTQRFVVPEGYPLSAGYDVVVCTRCGLGYADTPVGQRAYDECYARYSKYADNETSTGGGESAWDAERLRVTAAEIGRVISDRCARIADIGCANGGLLRFLKALGYANLCGLDPSPACVKKTAEISGVEAYVGSLAQIPLEAGPFDCIVLSRVLEHVRDLQSAIKYLRKFLNRGACLYVETPDATRYADFVFAPFQDFNTEHINHFSLTSLANLLRQCGFTPAISGVKVTLSAPGMPSPGLFIFATLAVNDVEAVPEMRNDSDLRQRLGDYVAISRQIMNEIETHLCYVLANAPQVLVWGTGQLAMKLLAETSLADATIVAFVDGNPVNQGRHLRGIPIIAPHQVEASERPIIVTSTLHHRAIAQDIRQLKLPNPVIALRPELALSEHRV